jgi:16S rRNA (uracil1498-N3)-methyltransferase
VPFVVPARRLNRTAIRPSRIPGWNSMPRYDFRSPRLYIDQPFAAGAVLTLDRGQTHYLADVLRLKPGQSVLAFNGRDGEWRGVFALVSRHSASLTLDAQTRSQTGPTDVHYLFAPLKRSRLDYVVQKAVEMGASRLQPVLTRHTQAERVNLERMRANIVEAAEQCGILTVPAAGEPLPLPAAVAALEPGRLIVFCDEAAPVADPVQALKAARTEPPRPLAVLIGPEGGFSDDERDMLLARPDHLRLALGPRIMRADTAAVAALALVQAVLGDWR